MAEERPTDIPQGYLGPQPKFSELQMECVSHKEPEFNIPQDNSVQIKFKVPQAIKSTCNLIQVRTEEDFGSKYVFTQSEPPTDKGPGYVTYVINFPELGWYKFQLFALSATEATKSLPNVFNYLIDVHRALNAVYAFPKQYAPWRNGCYLHHPLIMNSNSSLTNVPFKVSIPNAKEVAVVAAGEWTHLKNTSGSLWEGKVQLAEHRDKNVKVTLNACFGEDESKFSTLLEYLV